MVDRWGSSTQEGSPSRRRKVPISNPCCRVATSLLEPTSGWCPNRNTRFPLHLKIRWGPGRTAAPANLCSSLYGQVELRTWGGASSHPRWNAVNVSGLASSRAQEAGCCPYGEYANPNQDQEVKEDQEQNQKQDREEIIKCRVATWNVGNLKPEDKQVEVFKTLSRQRVDICGVQEHKWLGYLDSNQAHIFMDKDNKY